MQHSHPLARWRRLADLTQQALANGAQTTRETIARIEGGSDPHVRLAVRITAVLDGHFSEKLTVEDIWTVDGADSRVLVEKERQEEEARTEALRRWLYEGKPTAP